MNEINTMDEAFDYAMELLGELSRKGVKVSLEPSRSRGNKEIVDNYDRNDRLKPCRWFHVTIIPDGDGHADMIWKCRDRLGRSGIHFDTGGMIGGGGIDWEFDWSFHLESLTRKEDTPEFVGPRSAQSGFLPHPSAG